MNPLSDIVGQVRTELENNKDARTIANGRKFFKEKIDFYGVSVPKVSAISRDYYEDIKDFDKSVIFGLCEDLWESGKLEESFVACNWSYYLKDKYTPEDWKVFERWIKEYVSNWASCDTLCNHSVGYFVEKYPEFVNELMEWTQSENRWVKRGAAVSLIIPARKGLFREEVFEIADSLLTDADDMVRKGYGWMLKAASQFDELAVLHFIMQRKSIMPRTALRYAIEKMTDELKELAIRKN